MSDTLTAASRDFAMWPAPVTSDDNKTPEAHLAMKARMKGGPRNTITSLQVLVQDWAAPQARDHFPAHSPDYVAAKKAEGHGMRNLNDEAATWRAPSDISKRGGSQTPEKRAAGGHSVNLEDQAEHRAPDNWPTPATRDHKGSSEGSMIRQDGKSRADMLDFAAEQFFPITLSLSKGHPPSSPAPPIPFGASCSNTHLNLYLRIRAETNTTLRSEMRALLRMAIRSTDPKRRWKPRWTRAHAAPFVRPAFRRRLNPLFVELLMRWPTGLSGFARPETAWTRWWQLMPSLLSALCSSVEKDEQERLL